MLNSCSKTHNEANDDKISLPKTNYVAIVIKINGIIKNIGGGFDTQASFEQYINDVANNNWAKDTKSGWGLFKLEGNTLYYERWYPKHFGGINKVFSHECEIINDTTFILKKQYRLVNGAQTEVTFLNQTYHFVAFANKPSSDNNFIR